jgi:hypothetical protein
MTLSTTSLLRTLGAVEDSGAIQDDNAALRLRIGPHSVHGGQYMSRWFQPTYRISAVINTGRSISLVESEMPAELETEDEGLAWLAAILHKALPNDVKPAWLLKGECLTHLLRNQT